ncbi:hypothetical protein ACLB1R_29905 [Escherichia coli]
MDRDLLELVDEFAWILEDTADFIAGRAVAAMTRYRQQLLPPLFSALMKYSDIHEYSWAAPGHQGGVGFTKTPAGRFYHDYYGENLFRTDMGIEQLPSVLCLTILATENRRKRKICRTRIWCRSLPGRSSSVLRL